MGDYCKLYARLWVEADFAGLEGLEARPQLILLLLFSFGTRNNAGVLPLTVKRWARVSRDGTVENVMAALCVLEDRRFILVDWDTEEVLIRTFIRNDELYLQPNLMTNALKDAEKVESFRLRAALAGELGRIATLMPIDKPAQRRVQEATVKTAKHLVKTLPEGFGEPFMEPFMEPFDEPFAEPPGVGGYVKEVGRTPTPTPTAAPTTAPTPATARPSMSLTTLTGGEETRPEPPPPDRHQNSDAMKLAYRVVGRQHPQAVRTALALKASELVVGGASTGDVEEALSLWLGKPNLGPGTLPSLVSEVIRRREAKPTLNAADQKARDWLE